MSQNSIRVALAKVAKIFTKKPVGQSRASPASTSFRGSLQCHVTELNNNSVQTVYATKILLTILWACIAVLLFVGSVEKAHSSHGGATGVQRHIVLRVDFADSGTALPRYSRTQVEQLLVNVTDLFSNISNNNVQTVFVVTEVFRLPGNKADYNSGGKMEKTMTDAIANAPAGVKALWANNVHAVLVLLSQKWDAGGSYYATRNVGLNGSALFVGNAVIGENPGDTDLAVWGRWAHEVGHNMQAGYINGVAAGGHPSGYQSDFDLMDANYPGRTGPVSLQDQGQFRHWLSPTKYQAFTPALGGGNAAIWAIEHDQNVRPNVQAVKVEITSKLYYMVSVRRRVRGDELNASFQTLPVGQRGIPDEGVMIERVDEVTNPQNMVTVIGRNKGPTCSTPPDNCNRQQLWRAGDTYRSPEVAIEVTRKVDDDNYLIRVIYNDVGLKPDVMISPWLSPPGNTWETTDIWVDSPVNGFGVFRYGMHDDGTGNMVPVGNGDDPAVGQTNRVYARIRNVGKAPASNVVATIEVTNPLGMGITNTTQWALVGKVDSVGFPQLASIPVGGFVDVFVDWKPTFTLTPAQLAAGVFYFHSCLRVRIDAVTGETVLANQDGDREQENISYFQVAPKGTKRSHIRSVSLHNDDLKRAKDIILGYKLTVPNKGPEDWQVKLNKGVHQVTLAPGERREIPIEIVPGPSANIPGQHYSVDVFGITHHVLVNDLDKKDRHNEFRYTGGARIEALVVVPTRVSCRASVNAKGLISVVGRVQFLGEVERPRSGLSVMAVGSGSKGGFLESSRVLMTPKGDGQFRGSIKERRRGAIKRVDCMFAGTAEVSSASYTTPVVRAN